MSSDAEIIRRSLSEPTEFGEIFERHFSVVRGYVARRIGASPAEEITSETFVIAFKSRERYDMRTVSARPWLLGIATNLIRHHLRDERAHLAAEARTPIAPAPPPTDDTERIDAERLRPLLAQALLSLTVADRETFLLVALGGLTYEEAAASLDVPVGTVRSRMHRARVTMQDRLATLHLTSQMEEPEG